MRTDTFGRSIWGLALGVLVVLTPTDAIAGPLEGLPGQAEAADLELNEDFQFEFDGTVLEEAEIYFSPAELFYLISHADYEQAIMVSPRERSVQSVDKTKLERLGPLSALLGEGAALESLGQFTRGRDDFRFVIDGKPARLFPRPPVLGFQDLGTLRQGQKRYAEKARGLRPQMAALKSQPVRDGDVLVRVFFGSWSPISERIVPKVMAFEEQLRAPGDRVRFEYYGLPKRFTEDPLAREANVWSVPTAVVYSAGEEIGRVQPLELDRPREHLTPLLAP